MATFLSTLCIFNNYNNELIVGYEFIYDENE